MESSVALSSDGDEGGHGLDITSNLPESIICHILSLLPTKYVVPTSLLSKRWKFLWTQVSTLDFDDSYDDPKDEWDGEVFLSFVNKVLLFHNTSIEKFRLSWMNWDCDGGYVNAWIRRAVVRNVKVLDLAVFDVLGTVALGDDFLVHLPISLFTCGTLESLSLYGPFLVDVPCVVCLPKLVVLNLNLVSYGSNEPVPKLLSGCPVLNSLRIHRGSTDDDYDYDYNVVWDTRHVPGCLTYSLAQFSFSGIEGLEDELPIIRFILKHGAVMKKIEITCTGSCDLKKKSDILEELSKFPRVSRDCQINFF